MVQGRLMAKQKPVDWESLDALLQYSPTMTDCSDLLDVSVKTLERRIKKKYKMTFREYREKKMSRTRMKLVKKALEKAFGGDNVMMIFCLKNICHWQNDPEPPVQEEELEFV
jgi:thymidylate kinase